MAIHRHAGDNAVVRLQTGQTVLLAKSGSSTPTRVAMGPGRDVRKAKELFGMFAGGGDIDLNASCLPFDGDNRAGDGAGETIAVDLPRLPATVRTLVFTVNSFQGTWPTGSATPTVGLWT